MSANADFVPEGPFLRSLSFLEELPEAMPEPFVAIGDDGSIGIEWERDVGLLYLTFGQDGDEAYWCSPDGAEWEGSLGSSIPRLVDAMFELMTN